MDRAHGSDEPSFRRVGSTLPSSARTRAVWTAVIDFQLPPQLNLRQKTPQLIKIAELDVLYLAGGQDSPVRGELETTDGASVGFQRDESLAAIDVPELERASGDGDHVPREGDRRASPPAQFPAAW